MIKLQDFLYLKDKADGTLSANIILAHKNCPDGAAAVTLFQKMFPQNLYIMTIHDKVKQDAFHAIDILEMGGNLIIADIAPPRDCISELFERVAEKNAFCGIYDHHESTAWLKEVRIPENVRAEIVFRQDRCGAGILYDRYVEEYSDLKAYEDFILYTNDRDLWLRQHTHSDDLAILHHFLGDGEYIKRFSRNADPTFSSDEAYLLRFSKRQRTAREEKLLRAMRISHDGERYKYGVIYSEGESSDLLNKAIELHDLEYAILINLHSKRASIRGRGNLNCAAYAERFGGGGHKCASGFPITFQEPRF